MAAIGVFSDSDGDLALFDAALRFLADRGARRFFFAGNRYVDLDEWVKRKRDEMKAQTDYSDGDFLADVSRFLIGLDQVDRPAAFGTAHEIARAIEELTRMKDKVVRTPERGSLEYESRPRKAMDMLGDVICCVVYDKNDLHKEDMTNAAVLVHGKEGEPKVVQIGARVFVTPGRLKGGAQPTVGLIEQVERQLTFSAFTLDGEALIDKQSLLPAGTQSRSKISAK